MKQILNTFSLIVSTTCALFSHGNSIEPLIPKDASLVIKLNLGALQQKSDGVDYLKFIKNIIPNSSYNYYDYNYSHTTCELIDLKDMIQNPKSYGIDMKSELFAYRKSNPLFTGLTYLFKLENPEILISKILEEPDTEKENTNGCAEKPAIIQRQTSNGKLFMTEKIVIGIKDNLAYLFINDRSKFSLESELSKYGTYEYSYNENKAYEDSLYYVEMKAYREYSDSLFYIKANASGETNMSDLVNEFTKTPEDIIKRAKERLKQRQTDELNKKFDKLAIEFENFLVTKPAGIVSDRNFAQLVREPNDVVIFINDPFNFLSSNLNPFGRGHYRPIEAQQYYKRVYTENLSSGYSLNFMDGQVKIKMYNTFGDAASKILKSAYSKKQSKNLFKYIDGTNLMAYASSSYNMKDMALLYEKMYFEILNNGVYSKSDRNILPAIELFWNFIDKDKLFGTFSDRNILAVNGFIDSKITYKSYDYDEDFQRNERNQEKIIKQPRIVWVFGIENKENAKELFDIVSKFTVFTKPKDNVLSMTPNREFQSNLFIVMTEDALILTNDASLALDHQSGYEKSKWPSKDDQKFMMSHNFSLKVYSSRLISSINESYPSESREMRRLKDFSNTIGDLTMFDSAPTANIHCIEATLNLNNSTENSLKVLLNLFNRP